MSSSTVDQNKRRRKKEMDVPESSAKRGKKSVFRAAPSTVSERLALLPFPPITYKRIILCEDGSFPKHGPKFEKGTTALAFIFDEGIMVAANHSSKSSESTKNVVVLNSHMLATISGGGEFLLHKLKVQCSKQEQMEGRKTSVEDALKWLAEALSAQKEELSIGILLAFCNESECGLYRMNSKGQVVKGKVFATGSGSDIALTLWDLCVPSSYRCPVAHFYDLRSRSKSHMDITQVSELAEKSVCEAACVAPHSGEIVSVYHLGSGGCSKLSEVDVAEWEKVNKEDRVKYVVIGEGW